MSENKHIDFYNWVTKKLGSRNFEFTEERWNEMEKILLKHEGDNALFDNWVSEKINSENFEFTEERWNEMEEILIAKKRKNRLVWWSSAAIGLIVTGLISYYTLNSNYETDKASKTIVEFGVKDNSFKNDNFSLNKENTNLKTIIPNSSEKNITKKSTDKIVSDIKIYSKNEIKKEEKPNLISREENKEFLATKNLLEDKVNENFLTNVGEKLTEKIENKPEEIKKEIIAPQQKNISEKHDTIVANIDATEDFFNTDGVNGKRMMGIIAGYSLMLNNKKTGGLSPVVGISYERALNKKWKFTSGILFTSSGKMNSDKTYSSTTFDIGINNYSDNVNTSRLDYVAVSVGLQRKIYKGSWITAGIRPAYLFNSQNTIVKTVQHNADAPVVSTLTNQNNYKDGYTPVDIILSGGYKFYINEKIIIDATYFRALNSLENKIDLFGNNHTPSYNNGVMISIIYNFVKFN